MGENNRNYKRLPQLIGENQQPNATDTKNLSIQPSQTSFNTSEEHAYRNLPLQLPVTHLKTEVKNSMHHLTDMSPSQSSQSPHQPSSPVQKQPYKISTFFSQYEALIKNLDNKQAQARKRTINDLNMLCSKCLDLKIELPNRIKGRKANANEADRDQLLWMMLIVSSTLNLWKLVSETSPSDKSLCVLDVVKKPCKKLISFLQISDGKESYFSVIPDKAKNKIILLMIIWAKQELARGNKEESLKICNLCSHLITHHDSSQSLQANNKVISKENKFKLHYLRMKIFNELGLQKEEVEEIIICESLLGAMGQVGTKQKDSKKIDNLDKQLFETSENSHKIQTRNSSNILTRLQKRKLQILGYKKSFKHISSHSQVKEESMKKDERSLTKFNSKFKQIRDSFQITCRDQQKTVQNLFHTSSLNKHNPTKRVRSISSHKFSRQKNEVNLEEIGMKNTVKQKIESLNNSKSQLNCKETANKFLKNGNKLRIEGENKKSLSACKGGVASIQNKKKIKQKYELTSKKLVKRAILSTNKNKQFQNVLVDLEDGLCNRQHDIFGVDQKKNLHFPSSNFYQLLAKRPENKHFSSTSNLKSLQGNSVQAFGLLNPNNQKKIPNLQKDQNIPKENRQKPVSTVSIKILSECIERIQRQTIQKYFQRVAASRKRRNINSKQNENCSQDKIENGESATEISQSDGSQGCGLESKSKQTSKDKALRDEDKSRIAEGTYEGEDEPALELKIQKVLFPGLGMCEQIKVVIKKTRHISHLSVPHNSHAAVFVLRAEFYCDLGVFCLIHKLAQNLGQPGSSIGSMMKNLDADLTSIRVGSKFFTVNYSSEEILSRGIVKYLKKNIEIGNKGLGLRLKQKSQQQTAGDCYHNGESETMAKVCAFNRIYLEKRSSLQYLFSDQNLYDIGLKHFYPSNLKTVPRQYADKLKFLYVAIQKKSKRDTQAKCPRKNLQKKVVQKVNIMSSERIPETNFNLLQNKFATLKMTTSKIAEKRKSILKMNVFQPIEVQENSAQNDLQLQNFLVPVVKYIVLGETSKPKHKLKTILTKTKENVCDFSIFSSEEESSEDDSKRVNKHRGSRSCKYGLLAPYIDDESTLKIRNISTSIYGHIIGKFFMEGSKKISLGSNIPEEFMLSLKYYLMIPDHINRPTNIIDQFYEKFEYTFFIKLHCSEIVGVQNKKTYIVTVNLFRIKKLYRMGLQKFYLLKFSVQEKKARTQVNQLIATSYDISKHFPGPQFNLNQFLQQVEERQICSPIQNVPHTETCRRQLKQELEQEITNVRIKSIGQKQSNLNEVNEYDNDKKSQPFDNDNNLNPSKQRIQAEINSARQQINSDSRTQSEAQVHSEIQLECKDSKKRKQFFSIFQQSKTNQKSINGVCNNQNSNSLHVNWNRLSCPEKRFFPQLELNDKKNKNMVSVFSNGSHSKNHAFKPDLRNRKINQNFPQSQLNSFVNGTNGITLNQPETSNNINILNQAQLQSDTGIYNKKKTDNVAVCLKKISERITIHKTFLHSKIGIQPSSILTSGGRQNEGNQRQKIACYANKFRFSRSKHLNSAQQFLSPHINCLEIIFQKTTRIRCDGVFAVLTVLKIKYCQQFYVKIYVPSCQKTMSFSISCGVFQYFNTSNLIDIFSPYVSFEPEPEAIKKQQSQWKQDIVGRITSYFKGQTLSSNEGEEMDRMKIIWGRIFKYLQFQRRCLGSQADQTQDGQEYDYYLIAKLGDYEAFVKNFSVDEYIVVRNGKSKESEIASIVQVEVSLGEKMDGLNFIQKNRHLQAIKASKKLRNRKRKERVRLRDEGGRMQSSLKQCNNIYESEANNHMVYICITNSRTIERICFSYYLCEILHLIDYSNLGVNKDHTTESGYDQVYRVLSDEFKEIILNYAILFKVLNYIKNEFIIQLQASGKPYLPSLYRDPHLKDLLKSNVDKILLQQTKSQGRNTRPVQQKENNIFNQLLTNLLSCTIELASSTPSERQVPPQQQRNPRKQGVKITFNSEIRSQQSPDLSFLVRKVVARKDYPISCVFLNKLQNKLKIYLTSSKNGRTRQIQIPIENHPLPFIGILMKNSRGESRKKDSEIESESLDGECDQKKKESSGELVLSLRNRLRKYHHNMTLLASI